MTHGNARPTPVTCVNLVEPVLAGLFHVSYTEGISTSMNPRHTAAAWATR